MFERRKIIRNFIIVVLLIIGMITSSVIMQRVMKKKYGYELTYEISDMDGVMHFEGCEITIESATLWDAEGYLDYLGEEYASYANWFDFYQDGKKLKVRVLELEINVLKLEESKFDSSGVHDCWLIFENTYTGFDPFLTSDINKMNTSFADMEIGEIRTFRVPYTIVEEQLTDEQWEKGGQITYQLVSETYPVKRIINITNITDCTGVEEYAYANGLEEDNSSYISTEADDMNYEDEREFLDGENAIYASGTETMVAANFEVTIDEIELIDNISQIDEIMSEDGCDLLMEYHVDDFDDSTGKLKSDCTNCYATVTVNIKNISDEEEKFNIAMGKLGSNKDEISSQVLYSSLYNVNGNDHNKLTIDIPPGDSVMFTAILLVNGTYDDMIWYYGVDYLGGQKTEYVIEWDMEEYGGAEDD